MGHRDPRGLGYFYICCLRKAEILQSVSFTFEQQTSSNENVILVKQDDYINHCKTT